MYPVNGEKQYSETVTDTKEEHDTTLIIGTAVMSALFLGLSVCMYISHRNSSIEDADECEIRRSMVDLEHESEARHAEGL